MFLRTIIIFLVILLVKYQSFSQEEDIEEADTNSAYSGFASVFAIPSSIGSKNVLFIGGIGSVIINDKYILGGYGMRKTGMMYAEKGNFTGKMISIGSAGIVGGYDFAASHRIKPVFQCFAGMGGLTVSTADSKGYSITEEFNRLAVFVPAICIEFNVFWYLWLTAGVDYMYVSGVKFDGYSNSDFSRFGGYVSLKVMTGN